MATRELEPMSVGQILDHTFRMYRENFVRFVTIVAVVQVPMTLVRLTGTRLIEVGIPGEVASGSPEVRTVVTLAGVAVLVLGGLLGVVAQFLCNAALLKSVSESYLGGEVTVGQAYSAVLPKLLTVIWAGLLVGIITTLGLLLLIVPGIIFSLWFALTTPAIIVEDRKATRGMGRSKSLVSGNLGKVFGVTVVVGIIGWIVGLIFGGLGTLLAGRVAGQAFMASQLIQQIFSLAGLIVVAPIGATAIILLYYDLRIRKEGFDLEMLAGRMGSTGTPSNAASPTQ